MMNIYNKYSSLGKCLLSAGLCAGVLSASIGAQAEVSQVPLGLSEGVPPNMMFTLDDSTSMAWAYVPDHTADAYKELIGNTSSRRFRASNTNPMYYNPSIIYEIPPEFDSGGNELIGSNKKLKTSFYSAPVNGYRSGNGSVNLSEDYEVVYEHEIPNTSYSTASHPFEINCSVSIWNNYNTESCKINNTTVSVRRTPSGCDRVTPSSVQLDVDGVEFASELSCSRSSRNVTIRTSTKVPAYYYEFDGNLDGGTCAARKNNINAGGENCYRLRWVDQNSAYDKAGISLKNADGTAVDGRQNFANWYSFYKTRALATVSAAGVAFYDLSPNIRFTWQSLIHCTALNRGSHGDNQGQRCGVNSFSPYSRVHKAKFYEWLYTQTRFNRAAGTPLRSAMQRSGEFLNKPIAWVKDPVENSGESYSCRPSYNVIMTDGMWNSDSGVSAPDHHDKESRNLPDGTSYSLQAPYPGEGASNKTLADYAFHYWSTDLNTSLENKVPAYMPYKNDDSKKEYWDPRNNPATWQHMSNFIMGLGLSNALDNDNIPWEGNTFSGAGYNNLLAGQDWPVPSASGNGHENNIYDLWHAAINSRGEFFSVDSPEAMVQAFQDILTRIADRKSSAAMPGTSASLETDGAEEDPADRLASYFYQTTFDSSDGWVGDIQKVKKYRKYNKDTQEFDEFIEQGWSAKQKMPNSSSRNIMIAGSGDSKLQAFTASNAGSPSTTNSLAYYLNINPEPGTQVATWQQRLEYLRGSAGHEGDSDGKLRLRSSILGDFLASQPTVVSGARYLEGFSNRLEGNTAYTTYMNSIKNRRGQLYVGGNDGMLHAFDTDTGVEKFAFIPTAVFPKLNKLTGKNYSHEYYVDGTPVVADVYDGSKWRTILVGTLRAGGKGLFALDITDPDEIKLLWELDESSDAVSSLDVKPGYSFPQPTVARLHNGKWAVVTGNGYKGEGTNNGAAALYIIDAIDGSMIKSLEVQSPIKNGGENGLSTPRLADYDSDGIADYAYAGDLHGNLWRFDLLGVGASAPTVTPPSNGSYGAKSGGTSNFKVSYGGEPMFTATSTAGSNRQPITSAPSLVRHPTRTGYLVMFGTGKYFEIGDKTGEESFAQSLYGIWDMKTKAEGTGVDIITRSQLQEQSITSETTGTGKASGKTREARIISNNAVEWFEDHDSTKSVVKRGWYLDLTTGSFTGEMIIENMRTLGSMLLLQTLVPNDDPCANGSTNWLYAINPATGGRTLHHALDTRTADDGIVSAIKFGSEGGVSISQNEEGFKANAPGDEEEITPPSSNMGRQSWRMIPDA